MPEEELGFLEHLEELRTHLIRASIALTLGFIVAYIFHRPILKVLVQPVMQGLHGHGVYDLQMLSITEGIMTYIKAALIVGVLLSMPLILREIWLFVAPGLYPNERKVVMPAFFVLFLFFVAGMLFSYLFFVPFVVDFLASMTPNQALLVPRLADVLSLALLFYLVFGVIFEVPLIMFILSFLGVFHVHQYIRASKYFVVAAFIIGAMFTPPDPLSQVLLAVPLCVLYGLGILASLAAGRTQGVVSALRVLGGMALVLIMLTVASFYIARAIRNNWIRDPMAVLPAGECVQYLAPGALGIKQGKNKVMIRRTGKGGLWAWTRRFKPLTPAGLWCKGSARDLVMTAQPSAAGMEFSCRGNKRAVDMVENALPCKDWPRTKECKGQDACILDVWLPRPGVRGFLDQVFAAMSGKNGTVK